jgi:hypothetical protein
LDERAELVAGEMLDSCGRGRAHAQNISAKSIEHLIGKYS